MKSIVAIASLVVVIAIAAAGVVVVSRSEGPGKWPRNMSADSRL